MKKYCKYCRNLVIDDYCDCFTNTYAEELEEEEIVDEHVDWEFASDGTLVHIKNKTP